MYFETFYLVNEIQPEKRIEFDHQTLHAANKEEIGVPTTNHLKFWKLILFYVYEWLEIKIKDKRVKKNRLIEVHSPVVHSTVL